MSGELAQTATLFFVDNAKGDVHHHEYHYLPFAEEASQQDVPIHYFEVDLGVGHQAVSVELTNEFLDKIIDQMSQSE